MLTVTVYLIMVLMNRSTNGEPSANMNLKQPKKLSVTLPTDKRNKEKSSSVDTFMNDSLSCDIFCAYTTMYYHRSKMSEYLCHQFLTNEILEGLSSTKRSSMTPVASQQTALLDDEGSSGYSVWLDKNNLWDEDYNQFEEVPEEETIHSGKDQSFYQGQDYETGEITGFALPASPVEEQSYKPYKPTEEHSFKPYYKPNYKKKKVIPKIKESWPSPRGKGWIGDDIFEIGLSALAFLAFGAFITNLIITCILGYQNTTMIIAMSTTMNPTATGTGGTGTGRAAGTVGGQPYQVDGVNVDRLANMVLVTLDNLEDVADPDKKRPRCLHFTLCNNNRINKAMQPSERIWLPLWSFALSWLSGRLEDNRMENLRASVLGLGGASCNQLYPNCNR